MEKAITISKNGVPLGRIYKEYLDYKRSFQKDYLSFFSNITQGPGSPFLSKFVAKSLASCSHEYIGDCKGMVKAKAAKCGGKYQCEYEIKEELEVVEIYFDTPTFDKITKDARTNSIAKLSMIGGTLGLLTGTQIGLLPAYYKNLK